MASRFWVGGTGTWDASDTTHWAATTGGAGGQSVPGSSDTATFDGSSGGGTVTVSHASLSIQSLIMGAFTGTLDFSANDNNVSLSGTLSVTGTGTRTLNMGDGTWTFTGANSDPVDFTIVTNLTFNANGSTIVVSNTAPTGLRNFRGGGRTFNVVTFAATTTGFSIIILGANTFATLNITAPHNIVFVGNVTQTITNAFSWIGDSTHIFSLSSGVTAAGGAATIVATGGGTIEYAVLSGLTFTTGTVTATNSYDLRSNTGVTITAPAALTRAYIIGG